MLLLYLYHTTVKEKYLQWFYWYCNSYNINKSKIEISDTILKVKVYQTFNMYIQSIHTITF